MRYLKTYEQINNKLIDIKVSIRIVYFPPYADPQVFVNQNQKKTVKGQWTSMINIDEIGNEYQKILSNIIWQKYFNIDDPCIKKYSTICRPVFEEYPKDLIDILVSFKDEPYVTKFKKSEQKIFWRKDPLPELEEISKMELIFDSERDLFEWFDKLNFLLNGVKNKYILYYKTKKFNL